MALNDDIDQIKDCVNNIHLSQDVLFQEIRQVSKKIDEIKSNRNEPCPRKEDLFKELTRLLEFMGAWNKNEAVLVVRRLTSCSTEEAKKLVGIICR